MTVDATEARITHAGEVAHWLADAASSRTTHVGGDVLHTSGVVGCYGNSAAVNHCKIFFLMLAVKLINSSFT